MKRIRVLIVDDSPVATNGLKSILRTDPDIEVVGTAADGLEATAKAEELKPSVILMDAQLPEMDGVEATRRIKERLPDIKILFLAVHAPYVDAALAAGADAFLMKDCGRREHLEAIRKLAEGGKNGGSA